MFFISWAALCSLFFVTDALDAESCDRLSQLPELPETKMNVTELIRYNGYPAEEYTVQTEDGYLLYIQRIPAGRTEVKQDSSAGPKPVIFIQHGLLCDASIWVTNLPNQSFGFVMADAGFDVWLGNLRGTTYGQRSVKYSVNSDMFWDFSWDEMASYDLPAMLKFVTTKTSQSSIYYAGHSEGTTIAFAEFSKNKESANMVKTFFALAPVVTVGHTRSPLKYLADLVPEVQLLYKLFGARDFVPSTDIIRWLGKDVCSHKEFETYCSNPLFVLCGFDRKQLNESRLPVYFSHTPSGTSVKNMIHFLQMAISDKFQMYNYYLGNWKHYGQLTAPVYNVADMEVPVAVYWGGNDWLADPTDARALLPKLPNKLYDKFIPEWDHLDFFWAMDAAPVAYDDIIKHIESTK